MNYHDPKMTTREIAHITGLRHKVVLSEAGRALIAAGINPEPFWHLSITKKGSTKRELSLPRIECMIAISGDYFSNKHREEILNSFKIAADEPLTDSPKEIELLFGW